MTNDKLLRQGEGAKPPCLSFCGEVMSRCIGRNNLDTLSASWKNYVGLLSDLAKMLSGRYNIANIITPIDVQISEAIMNFQDNANNISQSVFEACSKAATPSAPSAPVPNRISRRSAPGTLTPNSARRNVNQQPAAVNEHQFDVGSTLDRRHDGTRQSLKPNAGRVQPANDIRASSTPGSSFLGGISARPLAIIDEIRTYMLSTKNFWSNLPNAVCTSNQTLGPSAANSNPTGAASRKSAPGNCFTEPLAIWDMNSDMRYTLEINQIIERFKSMDSKIRDALAGREIDWSSAQNQRPTAPDSAVTRPQIVTYPTSTTMSSTIDPDTEGDTEESDPYEDPGSGSLEDPERDPEDPESESGELESETEDNPTTDEPQPGPVEFPPDNSIDTKPSGPMIDRPDFITADPSPHKSGAASLVIFENLQLQTLFASLLSLCFLSVVDIFHEQNHYHFSFDGRASLAMP